MLSLCNLKAKYGKLSEYDQLRMAYVQGIRDALEVVKDHYSCKVDTIKILEEMANFSTPSVVLNEHYTLYGCDCWFDKTDNKHKTEVNGKIYERNTMSDLMDFIQQLQAGVGDIKVGDIIKADGYKHIVTAEPYIPEDRDDSAIDDEYIDGEYIIPVDGCSIIYEHEID